MLPQFGSIDREPYIQPARSPHYIEQISSGEEAARIFWHSGSRESLIRAS